jgi:hypothetical protein
MFVAGSAFADGRFIPLALLDKIKPGVTTEKQVLELLGPSPRTIEYPRTGLRDLRYQAVDYGDYLDIYVSIGKDGVVREVTRMKPGGGG